MANVTDTLAERGSRYGAFSGHAKISQDLKAAMQAAPKWALLTASMKEALEMVQHKVARILNGDPAYPDSWHDISGYATLVEQEIAQGPFKADYGVANTQQAPTAQDVTVAATYGEARPVQALPPTAAAVPPVQPPAPERPKVPSAPPQG